MFETGGTFPNAARAEREVLHLPAHPEMSLSQIDTAASKIAAVITTLGLSGPGQAHKE
jgi:dTDP-4-amino-4,6-dideoxygalactose transaminase